MKISVSLGSLVAVFLAVGSANAAEVGFAGELLPDNEVTAPDTTGHAPTGGAIFVYDDATKTLCGRIEFDDLTGAATGIHVHKSPKDMPKADGAANDKVIIPITTSPATFKVVLPADWATALMVGEIYANVHTAKNTKGEIRASMDPFPEYPGEAAPVVCPATALQIGVAPADAGTDSGTSSSSSSSSSSSTSSSGSTGTNGDNNTSSSSSSGSKPPIADPAGDAPPADSGGCSTTASSPASFVSVGALALLAFAAIGSRSRKRAR